MNDNGKSVLMVLLTVTAAVLITLLVIVFTDKKAAKMMGFEFLNGRQPHPAFMPPAQENANDEVHEVEAGVKQFEYQGKKFTCYEPTPMNKRQFVKGSDAWCVLDSGMCAILDDQRRLSDVTE